MFKPILFFVLFFAIFSCTEEEDAPKKYFEKSAEELFDPVEILFDEDSFDNPKAVELLQEIKICNTAAQKEMGLQVTDCSPKNFKFFPLKKGVPLDNGFILLVKATTGGVALRRVLIFERERGSLVKVNGFVANIIGQRTTKTGYNDLLLRFIDIIEGSDVYYNCLFQWENGKYQFKSCETIQEPAGNFSGKIKESLKDSVSREILKIIEDNEMIF